ncbi:MAG TPA: hypothetical protein VIX89_19380 [Bryobacteraceae bacterium]
MLFNTVAPLHDLDLGHNVSFQLAPDASLVPIPDWLRKDASTIERLSQQDQNELAACTHCLLCEYEIDEAAGLLVSGVDERRSKKGDGRSANAVRYDLVFLANLALWLQRLPSVGFNLVFHARKDSRAFNITESRRHERFLYHSNDEIHRRRITRDDLESVQRLYVMLSKIQRHSPPWAALRAVTSALQMRRNEIRHLLLWIALEALFGVADGEIKYRLSQRLAFFVANDRIEAKELFAKAKQGYDARCKMAHGAWGPKTLNTNEAVTLTGVTEEFIRRAFVRLLQDDETIKHFCGSEKNRCAYLDHLPFEESRHPGTPPTSEHLPEKNAVRR